MAWSPEDGMVTRLQYLQGELWSPRGIRVAMKREDERDPVLGGNKWCKLQGHLERACADGISCLVSVGGPWSNHLHALAHAGARAGLKTVGLVRRDNTVLTPTLQDAVAAGMQLQFVPAQEYRRRHEPEWQVRQVAAFESARFIPEGGAGADAEPGLARLAAEIAEQMQGEGILAVPVGSGTTFRGLRKALPAGIEVWAFPAFADSALKARLEAELPAHGWRWWPTLGMRTHGRLPAVLADFMNTFEAGQGIPLDSIYTVRLMQALAALLAAGEVPAGAHVVALHTGGLQGRRGHGLVAA